MAIEKLPYLDQVTASTSMAVSQSARDYQAQMNEILEFLQANIVFPAAGQPQFTTQYAAPSSTGFSVQVTDGDDNIHLILTPTAGFAAGTIVLPAFSNAVDKQEVLVNCTQQITTLTINGNGALAVTGEPLSMGADDFFRLKYDLPSNTWYRIG
jgi:hypothetical protein